MQCAHRHTSYATWRLHALSQLFNPARLPTRPFTTTAPQHSTTLPQNDPTNLARQEEANPTPKPTSPSTSLPKSPLLTHPRIINNTAPKLRKLKPTPEDKEAADLRKNPWAMALISPLRMCSATKMRIPRAFMGDWGFVKQKGREELWFEPVGLLPGELEGTKKGEKKQGEGGEEGGETVNADPGPGSNSISAFPRPPHPFPSQQGNKGQLLLRIVDRFPVLKLLTGRFAKGGYRTIKSPIIRIFPSKWKAPHGPLTAKEESRIIWRSDMPEFFLKALRRRVLKKVLRVAWYHPDVGEGSRVWRAVAMGEKEEEGGLVGGLGRLDAGIESMGTSGVLVIGSKGVGQGQVPDFVTLPQTGSKVPVFDLRVLFSDAEREELMAVPAFRNQALLLRPDDWVSLKAMLGLWKLKNALRELV